MNAAQVLAANGLGHGATIVQAARETGVELAIAAAFVERETRGRHVYGHDAGGTYSTGAAPVTLSSVTYPKGSNIPVTRDNYATFLARVLAGGKSNGVGLFQLTYAGGVRADGTRAGGFLTQARDRGFDLSDPLDNARFGLEVIRGYLKGATTDQAILEAATRYNAGSWSGTPNAYGSGVLAAVKKWRPLLAAADGQAVEVRRMVAALGRAVAEL